MNEHESVLLAETIEQLAVTDTALVVDCTFGRGGHTKALLQRLGKEGRIIAIDRDPSAIDSGRQTLNDARVELVHERFSSLERLLESRKLREQVDGILMDLGVSSPQLDNADRGFSFRAPGPLDMRMDTSRDETAASWLARASEQEIRECFWAYGEERYARRIARAIVEQRRGAALETTTELAELVRAAVPSRHAKIHPATRVFQALRIQVNDELGELQATLSQACECLKIGGRVAVIAFHSLEDRIVKRFFRDSARPRELIDGRQIAPRFRLVTRKPIRTSDAEIARNPRARSARLRVLERIA